MKRLIRHIEVRRSGLERHHGILVVGGVAYRCALGRSGIVAGKREGDGGTPRARLALRTMLVRPGRLAPIRTALSWRRSTAGEIWCDDVGDRRYNRLIRNHDGPSDERLWREDRLYDVIVPLGWNDGPIRRGRGSAIFWHVARPGFGPTAGCVAIEPDAFRKILPRLSPHARMRIW